MNTQTTKKKKGVSNGAKTSPQTAKAKMMSAKAVELRMCGMTFEAIAKKLGYAGKQGAYDAVKRALDATVREPATELIRLDLERLDALWATPYQSAISGNTQALAACLKIMERRAKLLGLDAGANGCPVETKTIPSGFTGLSELISAVDERHKRSDT